MSTVQGMFSNREVEARFAPQGFVRIATGHYRRRTDGKIFPSIDDLPCATIEPVNEPAPPRFPSKPKHVAVELIALTYGDFMEVATGIGADPQKLWDWAVGVR